MHRTRGVKFVKPGRHRRLVRTIATLVAQTPENNGRMILVTLSHSDSPIEKGVTPIRRRSQRASQTMRLTIGLIHHIHAHRIAELIPAWTIGIVSQSHGIDMGSLHQSEVLKHTLLRHHTSRIRVVLVTIDTTNFYGFVIDEQLSALDADITEADLLGNAFDSFPVEVLELQFQRIKTRALRTPKTRIVHLDFHTVELTITPLRVPLVHTGGLVLEVEDFVCCD